MPNPKPATESKPGWIKHTVSVSDLGTQFNPPLPLTHRLQRWVGNRWRKYDWPKHKNGDVIISRKVKP